MKKIGIFMLGILFAFSCKEEKKVLPADIIQPKAMVQLMADIQLAEASIQIDNLTASDSAKLAAVGLYKGIFERHHVSEALFRKSFNWYAVHPEEFTPLYEEVITELTERQ